MPRAIDRIVGPAAGQHIDAYQEYSNLVGRLDGGSMWPEARYNELRRRAADGRRRLYVNWRNTATGLDCKAIGPQTMCFCNHRYNEHDWLAFDTKQVRCKMPGCNCSCFNYIPVRGSQDLKCTNCHRSFRDHHAHNHGCPTGGGTQFASSYNCSCTGTYSEHETVFESRSERERASRPVDAGWMEQASKEGLPVCHLGGIIGFTSLADGIDRAYAGLEGDDVQQAVFAREGAVGDMAANRFVQRMQLEDTVNTASVVHGRVAGHRALAKAQAKRLSMPGSSSRQRAASMGPLAAAGGTATGSSAASQGMPRANIHTLSDAPATSSNPGPRATGRPQSNAGGRTAAPARHSSSVPPGGRSAASGGGGRRLGGARQLDAASMREARLAKLDT